MSKKCFLKFIVIVFCTCLMFVDAWAKPPAHAKNPANRADTVVETEYGRVMGDVGENYTLVWKGIPFAKPPVGELRWKAPVAPEPWKGVRQAKNDCLPCTQSSDPDYEDSEDCLYLNIWRPDNGQEKLPVYFWIHGGSNKTGSALSYDGSGIAVLSNMVVVVIQYRLGPLGWFYHPILQNNGNPMDDSGNFGTMDVLKALEWVQGNIANFGGDPDNITIAGESAGAHDVLTMIISPLAKGLFHKAISESAGMRVQSPEEGIAAAENTFELLSAPADLDADYLRSLDNKQIIAAAGGSSRGAYADGYVVPATIYEVIESGVYNKVPTILGSNKDEWKYFNPYYYELGLAFETPSGEYTWADLPRVLQGELSLDEVLPEETDKFILEACNEYKSLNWRYSKVDRIARLMRANEDHENIYAYLFKWDGEEESDYNFIYGAAHATEIPFFFGSPTDIWDGYAFSPENDTVGRQALSSAMMNYVKNFANTSNPNGDDLPLWEEWSNMIEAPKSMVLDATETDLDVGMILEEITQVDVEGKFWELYFSLSASERPELSGLLYYFK